MQFNYYEYMKSKSDVHKKVIFYNLTKRFLDLVFSFIGIILTLPIIILVSILIKVESPGPVFYYQERLGYNGKKFKIVKLRSMVIDAEKSGVTWAQKNDSRVTNVGKFIRCTRIDELPQFFNILKGDMTFIGPRPEREFFYIKFHETIPDFYKRLEVKPGLTGWAQVNGGYDINPSEKLNYDLYYLNNKSLLLDLEIIFRTIKVVLTGDGAR